MKNNSLVTRFGHAEVLALKTATVPPFTSTNTVIYGEKRFVVIDPAPKEPESQQVLIDHIDHRVRRGQEFLAIFLTHHHDDHTLAAPVLRDFFKVPISAHQAAKGKMPFQIDKCLRDMEEIALDEGCFIKAIHTPGHADSHIVFYDEHAQLLIAGDMITDRGCVLIPPGSGCLKTYLENLKRLSLLKLKAIIPAHGQIIKENPNQFLHKAYKHRLQRILSILETIENSVVALDISGITRVVYQDSLSEQLLPFAKLSVESSLSWLLAQGFIERDGKGGFGVVQDIKDKKQRLLISDLFCFVDFR